MENNFNEHLGKKLRFRRLSLGLTQSKVGEGIGYTFQQIQKYEKGTNGVSSEKLLDLANFLKVPVTYFYEGYSKYVIPIPPTPTSPSPAAIVAVKEEVVS